jgi:hypothetical protein
LAIVATIEIVTGHVMRTGILASQAFIDVFVTVGTSESGTTAITCSYARDFINTLAIVYTNICVAAVDTF